MMTPATNRGLGERSLRGGGARISEVGDIPEGQDSRIFYKTTFLQRNRIVAALADVVIVVEATRRSGTLNTVRHALAQGKEVMAVPGNVNSPLSEGCNRLIAQGATPLLELKDVLEKLGLEEETEAKVVVKLKDKNEQRVYELIAAGVTDGEELREQAGVAASEFNVVLTMLEVQGLVRNLGGNKWGIR
jgi:DNA processing protein